MVVVPAPNFEKKVTRGALLYAATLKQTRLSWQIKMCSRKSGRDLSAYSQPSLFHYMTRAKQAVVKSTEQAKIIKRQDINRSASCISLFAVRQNSPVPVSPLLMDVAKKMHLRNA